MNNVMNECEIKLVDGVLTLGEILKFCEEKPADEGVDVSCADNGVTAQIGCRLFPEADVVGVDSIFDAGCHSHVKRFCRVDERFREVIAGFGECATFGEVASEIRWYLGVSA